MSLLLLFILSARSDDREIILAPLLPSACESIVTVEDQWERVCASSSTAFIVIAGEVVSTAEDAAPLTCALTCKPSAQAASWEFRIDSAGYPAERLTCRLTEARGSITVEFGADTPSPAVEVYSVRDAFGPVSRRLPTWAGPDSRIETFKLQPADRPPADPLANECHDGQSIDEEAF